MQTLNYINNWEHEKINFASNAIYRKATLAQQKKSPVVVLTNTLTEIEHNFTALS